jgi:hypothetical protein
MRISVGSYLNTLVQQLTGKARSVRFQVDFLDKTVLLYFARFLTSRSIYAEEARCDFAVRQLPRIYWPAAFESNASPSSAIEYVYVVYYEYSEDRDTGPNFMTTFARCTYCVSDQFIDLYTLRITTGG